MVDVVIILIISIPFFMCVIGVYQELYRTFEIPGFLKYSRSGVFLPEPEGERATVTILDGDARIDDRRGSQRLILDRILSVFRELWYALSLVPYRLGILDTPVPPDGGPAPVALMVLVHGLRGHPAGFRGYIEDIRKHYPATRLVVPHVHLGGLCPLEEAAAPILEIVRTYLETFPDDPVYLVGHSNGARIVAYIETRLRSETTTTKIHVATIGGPFHGSSAINLLPGALARYLYPRGLYEELRPDSVVSKRLLEDMITPLASDDTVRTYTFTGTLEEHSIWSPVSAFPLLPNLPTKYAYVCGAGHSSAADVLQPFILRQLLGDPYPTHSKILETF